MAVIEEGVKALIASKSAITAYVSDRIYHGEAPQNQTADHLIFTVISDVPEYAFGGMSVLLRSRVQIDVYSTNRSTVATLIKTVRDQIKDYSGTVGSVVIDWVEYITSGELAADDTNRPKLCRYSGIWIFHYRTA
jgi:hypothetical protein